MKKIFFAVLAAGVLTGCLKSSDNTTNRTCTYNECGVVAPEAEVQALQTYLDTNNITATKHCSGLFYRIDTAGTGNAPNPCAYISVRYKGSLTNGTVFESTTTPTQFFPLSNTIRGWVNGLPLIKEGGTIQLYIPPTLGYAGEAKKDNSGNVVIPANSILIFEVKLGAVVQ